MEDEEEKPQQRKREETDIHWTYLVFLPTLHIHATAKLSLVENRSQKGSFLNLSGGSLKRPVSPVYKVDLVEGCEVVSKRQCVSALCLILEWIYLLINATALDKRRKMKSCGCFSTWNCKKISPSQTFNVYKKRRLWLGISDKVGLCLHYKSKEERNK